MRLLFIWVSENAFVCMFDLCRLDPTARASYDADKRTWMFRVTEVSLRRCVLWLICFVQPTIDDDDEPHRRVRRSALIALAQVSENCIDISHCFDTRLD